MALGDVVILSGSGNPKLAEEIGYILKTKVYFPVEKFSDGEIRMNILPILRKKSVFIIQPTSSPVNDNLMELFLMVDSARRADASQVTAIIPYFGYSRQDRKDRPRVAISSATIAKILESLKLDRILTLDIHSEQQQGFFYGPWDNLYGSYSLIPAIKAKRIASLVVASPDKGGVKRAVAYADRLNAKGVAIVYKGRDFNRANVSEALDMIGDVRGKNVLIVDDMIDTGGTIVNAAKLLLSRGAKSVMVAATHGIFSGQAIEKLSNSGIKEILVTNTIPHEDTIGKNPKVKIISIADLLAKAISRIHQGKSLSKDLIK